MRLRRGAAALAVALVSLAVGCGRCGRGSGARGVPPERHLPPGSVAIVLPRLDVAAREAALLLATAERFPALAGLAERRAAVAVELGLDPLDPGALEAAGLAPDGGAALARTPSGPLAVLPVADARRLEETLGRLARDRLGAGERSRAAVEGTDVTSFHPAGAAAALSVAAAGGIAVVAPGPGGAALAARALRFAAADALDASAPWKTARGALPPRAAALLFLPPGAPLGLAGGVLRDGAALALSAGEGTVDAQLAIVLPPARAEAWRAVAGGGGDAELSRLPRDAVVAARLAGDPAPVARRLLALVPGGDRWAPIVEELLPLLAPGAAASIGLAPTFDFSAFSRRGPGPSAVAADPFRFVRVAAVLHARDDASARQLLALAAARAPALGLAARDDAGTLALVRGAATVRVAVDGARVLVAGGEGALEELRALAGRPDGFAPPVAADLVRGGLAGVAVAPGTLVRAARALPDGAFGSGPDRFVMRSVADRVLDPASRLAGAALRVELADGAARVSLRVEARAEAAP